MTVEWVPERYPASGTIGAAGFYKLLGRPQLDPLTVLVRETAQNSWDARKSRARTVNFAMHGRELTSNERATLIQRMLPMSRQAIGTGLGELPDLCTALFISDRGTKGLGGPVSASAVSDNGVYDWVDFVLNVGKANTQGHTGGTYGFGKTIAYVVSSVNTVIVYSRAMHEGRFQSRLIACAIGSEFTNEGALFTGRHWWGRNASGAPSPLLDQAADELALALGMPRFDDRATGTTLMIIQPDFGERTAEQGMRFVVEAALWNLWPKLVPLDDRPSEMKVEFSWNGAPLVMPSPDSRPPLGGFVQALQEMVVEREPEERPPGFQLDSIRLERPKRVVGALATVPLALRERAEVDDGHSASDHDSPQPAAMIAGPAHHVALLRSPNLVVEYLEGPASPEASFEWVGVFKTTEDDDHVFAMAEPPTHDTWRPELIAERTEKSIVKMALQNIRKILDSRWGTRADVGGGLTASTAGVARRLAHLVAGSLGTGASVLERDQRPRRPPGNHPSVEILSSGPLDGEAGSLLTQLVILVHPAIGAKSTELAVSIGIALAGGGIDHSSDPGLSLRSITVGGTTYAASGVRSTIALHGSPPIDVTVVAARTTQLSVAFDVHVSTLGGAS